MHFEMMVMEVSNIRNFSFKRIVDKITHIIFRVIYPNMKFNTYLLLTIKKKILTVRLPSHSSKAIIKSICLPCACGQHVEALWVCHVVGDSMKVAARFWII